VAFQRETSIRAVSRDEQIRDEVLYGVFQYRDPRVYTSSNIVRMIKYKKNEMRRACRTYGESRGVYRVWCGNLRVRDCWENRGVDGKIY
jgi:hypothetical protein